jgi:hypothetical protein
MAAAFRTTARILIHQVHWQWQHRYLYYYDHRRHLPANQYSQLEYDHDVGEFECDTSGKYLCFTVRFDLCRNIGNIYSEREQSRWWHCKLNFKVNGISVQNTSSNTYTSSSLANGNTVTCTITITVAAAGQPIQRTRIRSRCQ